MTIKTIGRPKGYQYPVGLSGNATFSNVTTDGSDIIEESGSFYVVKVFDTSDSIILQANANVEYMVVGGGGGGGAGGGGAGGFLTGYLDLTVGVPYTATVGSGGTSLPTGLSRGGNSTFALTSTPGSNLVAAVGGGFGGPGGGVGQPGGSGGGGGNSSVNQNGGVGTAGQGNPGFKNANPNIYSGGGGGAGSGGPNSTSNPNGGSGLSISWSPPAYGTDLNNFASGNNYPGATSTPGPRYFAGGSAGFHATTSVTAFGGVGGGMTVMGPASPLYPSATPLGPDSPYRVFPSVQNSGGGSAYVNSGSSGVIMLKIPINALQDELIFANTWSIN